MRQVVQVIAAMIVVWSVHAAAGPLEDGDAAAHRGDHAAAVQLWLPLAEQGDAQAQYRLGLMFGGGLGVRQDDVEAAKWYRRAAEHGLASAQNDLGAMLARGQGVKRDLAEALRWYRAAAAQGHPEAQNSIGSMYLTGDFVDRDPVEAVRWFRLAAEQGLAFAQSNLGVCYAEGWGVGQDAAEAARWYRRAADQDSPGVFENLGELYELGKGREPNLEEALFWYEVAVLRTPHAPFQARAREARDRIASMLSPARVSAAKERAQAWRPGLGGQAPSAPVVASAIRSAPASAPAESASFSVPPPRSTLPRPYAGAVMNPVTPDEEAYARYLLSTPMFPDEEVCNKRLAERLRGVANAESIVRTWVTKPFLVWGGTLDVGALVGPIEHLYSIIEAHVTFQDSGKRKAKLTYSCYVQYARLEERSVWRAGHLKYGEGIHDGHRRHAAGPAHLFGNAAPGTASDWEPGIRYLRK